MLHLFLWIGISLPLFFINMYVTWTPRFTYMYKKTSSNLSGRQIWECSPVFLLSCLSDNKTFSTSNLMTQRLPHCAPDIWIWFQSLVTHSLFPCPAFVYGCQALPYCVLGWDHRKEWNEKENNVRLPTWVWLPMSLLDLSFFFYKSPFSS